VVTPERIRVIVADDERPARSYLTTLLRRRPDTDLVGEAESGVEAVSLIERERPDLAFLDLQMPELDGLGVVRLLKRKQVPLIVFVTAYEEYALRAFELNAVDYLLKPVNPTRLGEALARAHDRLDRSDIRASEVDRVNAAVDAYEQEARLPWLERIPVRRRDVVTLLPTRQIASIVAEHELLHITTVKGETHTITYRLKDLESRLGPTRFVRLGRGTLTAVDTISKVHLLAGGGYLVSLTNGQELQVSRIQSRVLRERLLKL
jgi:two-component system LytT family response regulator